MGNHARAQLHAAPRGGAGGDQSRRSNGTGGEPGPMDIEVARRRSHEPTAVRARARTRMAGIYSTLDRYNMLGRITRLPPMEQERCAGRGAVGSGRWQRITVQRADSEPEPRCYRWRLGHDTGPTDNANGSIGGSILYSPFIRDRANLTLPHLPMTADTPITSVTSHASLRH